MAKYIYLFEYIQYNNISYTRLNEKCFINEERIIIGTNNNSNTPILLRIIMSSSEVFCFVKRLRNTIQ